MMINDFTSGSVPKKMLRFALPLVVSGMLQTVYSMVDMMVVGNLVGGAALSAVSIGGDVLMLLTFVSMGMANAGQIIISQYIGAGQKHMVKKLIGTLFTFLLSCAVCLTVICFILRVPIMHWLNTPSEAWDYASSYITTCILGLVFIYGYNLVSAIMRGMGDSKRPFLFIAVASVINLVLDLLFIGVFHMAALGAALATVIGQGISFFLALFVLYHEREQIGFDFKPQSFRIDREVMIPLLRLGIPMIIQSASITFSKLFVNSWVNSYGYIASAVSGIGTKLDTICSTFSQAINVAGGTMIAQNIGAKKTKRVPEIMLCAFCMACCITIPLSAVTFLLPRQVFGFFCSEEEILLMALTYVPIALVLFAGSTLRVPMFSLINGSGNPKLNLAVALLDGIFVRIGLALFLGLTCGMGVYGFWYGHAISGFVPFFIGGAYYLSGTWKHNRAI
ncbi:MAG: MATE family efflux transporter [Lachnospiraceae bacterium]|nr:MATE family efflux transporter [Lachnospiraceae bacterium]